MERQAQRGAFYLSECGKDRHNEARSIPFNVGKTGTTRRVLSPVNVEKDRHNEARSLLILWEERA